ncbi:MAG: hypothetical protein A2268_09095 [Candidatus Raymondbacteria bacterium RifOxyA12_full_50_37]|uniref:BrnT family toxin n=1 Tax=Candidatus Raymondbacteria bacterium RIFOXYD12_FULL_49_13 TaxID=1817890 RepID=A0A1F7F153_UNCRA|nr:MAG: hypothetical protein A2268_09095 [Candidatus Raymondbacteria bacterium RifOxyA12_full_50_37]OGJ86877.1 MAG: hypothetical protein A2248_08160 [Candidatus Raymondbacteria bacterium RIFOXYA2_FULL_49_16]OGJ94783.1 MAG: hypothetical protein A2350_20675 [Candidatus Raymondbacteria bacterium RifOxyB12_full_50_8]OGJ98032.1 MAG: hypothetical protein A2487_00840 [Candidatus Raymondbacteria bacterium RifOxyC12_full_50_8]OGK00226.1 MAG: hypothetical protein A2519_07070 [Candidatus Raymondbacteria b
MNYAFFEWDDVKDAYNQQKHDVSFTEAQEAFFDEDRITAVDKSHSNLVETRYYCIGKIERGVVTVRFTFRNQNIRIIGAGFWRKGKKDYEEKNCIH